jgi:ferric-dicitrate binding protein FerR (iron transport regulator)
MTEEKKSLISRYLNGDCSSDEITALLRWIKESEENKEQYLGLKDIWDASLQRKNTSEKELLSFYKQQVNRNSNSSYKIRFWRWSAGVAAMLAIGLLFSILYQIPSGNGSNLVTYTVPLGARSEVQLADGTLVNLNSGSKLQYPANFNSKNRKVILSGEAFFTVTSDKSNPFVVKTSDFDISVTGTKFNVCSYDDNNFSSAALLEGKITLSASNIKPIELKPGEKLALDRVGRKLSYSSFDDDAEVAWKNGKFIFSKIPFPELIKKLERWYDVKLNYNSRELESLEYSGSFKNQETIWQVLDALKITSPIEYSRKDFREFNLKYKPKNN